MTTYTAMTPLAAVTLLIILGGPPALDALCPFSSRNQGIQIRFELLETSDIE